MFEDAEFSPFMEDIEAEIRKEMKKKSGERVSLIFIHHTFA